jgi:2-dehydro-3-deoxy-D-gluconate 5-dehydrogenase
MNDIFSLEGRVAIVTGGNRGLGKAMLSAFAAKGADCVIAARDREETAKAAKEIKKKYGVQVLGLEADISKESDIDLMVTKTLQAFGKINILVNNAGTAESRGEPQDMSADEWDRVINTNLRAVFLCCKAVYPAMKAGGGGKIINIGSMASIFGDPGFPAYGTSKGGVVQLTKSLAVAWARDNIQVNVIYPGWFKTKLGSNESKQRKFDLGIARSTPMGRWGETEEMGGTAVYLASHASDFITGVVIRVDGGYSLVLHGMDGPFIVPVKSSK